MKKKLVTTPDNARNPEQKKIIQEWLDRGEDPFERKNILKIPGNKLITENDFWYVLKNKWPYPGLKHHLVIICKRNIQTITEMTKEEVLSLFNLQKSVLKGENIDSGAWCMRFGEPKLSGTTVTRLHGHIGRYPKSCTPFLLNYQHN